MAFHSVTQPPDEPDDSGRGTSPISEADAAILKEILDDYDYDVLNWTPIRLKADIDVSYAANDTWTEADAIARGHRPMVNIDQLSQYRNQIENTVRQNKRGVKVSPAGKGATKGSAELRANRIREIEYQSHAQEAYSQGFSDCLTRSYGFARIVAEYEDDDTRNQVFRTKSIPNPNQVIPDTDGQSTSGRDWKRCVFLDSLSHREFRRAYPDATIRDFDPDVIAGAPQGWLTTTRVQVAECWRVTETPNPRGYGKPTREVCMYLTNGLELLAKKGEPKKHPWKGKYIPFASCLGRVVYRTSPTGVNEKQIQSYIRFALDAAKGFNWTWSTIFEKLALPVKASLMGYKGQADNDTLALIKRATQEHVPWMDFSATTEATGTAVLPLPQYGTREADIQGDLMVAEACARNIQNALGHFNAADGRLGGTKVTSGIALQEQKRAGDLGSFDFQDHFDDFLKFLGEQYDDLLDHYDDASKEIATRTASGETEMVTIHTKTGRDRQGNPAYDPKDARMDGRHTVSIATGPATDSQQEANSDFADHVIDSPQILQIVGPQKAAALVALAIKLKGAGAIGDQMAEIVDPQQGQDGQAPDPRHLQQQLAEAGARVKHAEAVMQQQEQDLKADSAKIASNEKIAQMNIDSKERLAALDRETKISVAELGAKVDRLQLFLEERGRIGAHLVDQAAQASTELHEHTQAELDRQHAAEQAARAQQHQVGMAAADAGAAADAQAAGHANTLEVGQQAADLAPAPPAGE